MRPRPAGVAAHFQALRDSKPQPRLRSCRIRQLPVQLFALAPGTVSRQFSTTGQTEFYKVVEKDPARALSDDQTKKIHDSAYAYWFDKNRRAHDVRKLVPGYEFQP